MVMKSDEHFQLCRKRCSRNGWCSTNWLIEVVHTSLKIYTHIFFAKHAVCISRQHLQLIFYIYKTYKWFVRMNSLQPLFMRELSTPVVKNWTDCSSSRVKVTIDFWRQFPTQGLTWSIFYILPYILVLKMQSISNIYVCVCVTFILKNMMVSPPTEKVLI
jgi:hypothetical protein